MKKTFALILALVMLLTMAACGKTTETAEDAGGTAAEEVKEETAVGEGTETDTAGAEKAESGKDAKSGTDANGGKTSEVGVAAGSEAVAEAGTVTVEAETVEVYVISAGGLELKYPVKWQEKVTVDVAADRVCFSCGSTKLFDLLFNSSEGYVLGTVIGEENTVICVVDYSFETEDTDLYAMQEDLNVILQYLMEDYSFEVGVAVYPEDNETFDIETSVVTMKYPMKWKDKVYAKITENGVYFSTDGVKLFDLLFFESDEGFLLGTYNGTPIYIVDYNVTTDEQAAMQEDVNVILQYLMEDPAFVINMG